MLKGFRDFILRGNVVDLAVAVIIGAAFNAVVVAAAMVSAAACGTACPMSSIGLPTTWVRRAARLVCSSS